jgi:hypothetical protein
MPKIIEEVDGVEIYPLEYSKHGSWKMYLLGYKENHKMMHDIREAEVNSFRSILFETPEVAEEEDFQNEMLFFETELKREKASLKWVQSELDKFPAYDPFI